jgi:hypothetical protein
LFIGGETKDTIKKVESGKREEPGCEGSVRCLPRSEVSEAPRPWIDKLVGH